jgi:hypothetical protein
MKRILFFVVVFYSFNFQAQMSPEEVVQKQLETYNNKDIEGFMSLFHPDAVIYALGTQEPIAKGKENIRLIYTNLFNQSPNLRSEIKQRIVFGNKVIDYENITGRKGSSEAIELIMIYSVEGNFIKEAYSIRKDN